MKCFNLIILLFLFTGCSINSTKQTIVGEYYLQQKQYKSGYDHFKKEIAQDETNDSTYYYFARFLLAQNKPKEALVYLKKAIELNRNNSIYYTWLGVTYNSLKDLDKEQESYKKALSLDSKDIHALSYLGHNYFDKKDYLNALKSYNKVLQLDSGNHSALYNRAKTLHMLKRTPEELEAWLKYLDYYPSTYLSRKAVNYLNGIGNFEYRIHYIGLTPVILKKIRFDPISNKISSESKPSLDVVGKILKKYGKKSIHIVVHQLNNKELAEQKALEIKKYLLKHFDIDPNRIKLSWFNQAKRVTINNKVYKVGETIGFFGLTKK